MNRPDHEIDAYLEGELTAEQARALEAWINANPDNAAAFLHLVHTHQTLGVIGKEQQLARHTADLMDPAALASLAEMEAAAVPQAYTDVVPSFKSHNTPTQSRRNELTLTKAFEDLCWAAGKAASKLTRTPAFIAVAATLFLAITLFLVFQGSNDSTDPTQSIIAESPDRPTITNVPVATLTATHNAVWSAGPASKALQTGDKLSPGDRLTLTQGFAEITTRRGAVAILEAPATIELFDNDNALRLHTGKLVGICQTQSSKGFVVRTPHMDITDIGTRFGVDASRVGTTEVHVLEGQVQAKAPGDATEAILLKRGESVFADASHLTRQPADPDRFTPIVFARTKLPGSGQGYAVGQVDPRWHIRRPYGVVLNRLDQPYLPVQVIASPFGDDVDTTGSHWMASSQPLDQWKPNENASPWHRVFTTIEIPEGIDLSRTRLRLSIAVKGKLAMVHIEDDPQKIAEATPVQNQPATSQVLLNIPKTGSVNIAFDLYEAEVPESDSVPWAIRVNYELVTVGPESLQDVSDPELEASTP